MSSEEAVAIAVPVGESWVGIENGGSSLLMSSSSSSHSPHPRTTTPTLTTTTADSASPLSPDCRQYHPPTGRYVCKEGLIDIQRKSLSNTVFSILPVYSQYTSRITNSILISLTVFHHNGNVISVHLHSVHSVHLNRCCNGQLNSCGNR